MNMIFLEDDLIIRNNYSLYLKKFFENVFETSSGIEALEILEKENIDFIIADIEMQTMNGLDFIKKVRNINKDIIVIIMSAYDKKEYLMEAIKLGLFEYLIKPVSRNTFQTIIFEVINKIKEKNKIFLKNDFIWDKKYEKLFYLEDEIKLTKSEMLLFKEFCEQNEKIFTFEDISELLYPFEEFNINKIRMLIKRIKKKLNHTDTLENIHNLGYKFKNKKF